MTPEERDLITRTLKLSEENNKMLRGMRRNARFSFVVRVIYWIIILGSIFGAYYFIQPFITAATNTYNDMQKNIQKVASTTSRLPALPSWLGGKQ